MLGIFYGCLEILCNLDAVNINKNSNEGVGCRGIDAGLMKLLVGVDELSVLTRCGIAEGGDLSRIVCSGEWRS